MGCGTGDPHRVLKGKLYIELVPMAVSSRSRPADDPWVDGILVEGPSYDILQKRAETIARQGVWVEGRFYPAHMIKFVDMEVVK